VYKFALQKPLQGNTPHKLCLFQEGFKKRKRKEETLGQFKIQI
jgi:hypothetical protein